MSIDVNANIIVQSIKLDNSLLNKQLKQGGARTIEIKPKFTATQVQQALDAVGARKLKVNISIGNADQLKRSFERIFNFENLGGLKTAVSEFIAETKKAKNVKLIDTKSELAQLEKFQELIRNIRIRGVQAPKGGFFDTASQQLGTALAKFDGDVGKLLKSFGGKDGASIKNINSALQGLSKQLIELDNIRAKASRQGILDENLQARIDATRQSLVRFFNTIEASNPGTLSAQFKGIVAPLQEQLKTATDNAADFDKALVSLRQRAEQLKQSGQGDSELFRNLQRQQAALKGARSSGVDFSTANAGIAGLQAQEKVLVRSSNAVDVLFAKIDKLRNIQFNSDLNKTAVAGELGTPEQIATVIDAFERAVQKARGRGSSPEALKREEARAQGQIKAIEDRVKAIIELRSKLASKAEIFDTQGLDRASSATGRLFQEILNLAKAGTSLKGIQAAFKDGVIKIDRIAASEKALEKYTTVIDRTRSTIKNGLVPDTAGAVAALDRLQAAVEAATAAGKSDRNIRNILNAGLQQVKNLNTLNRRTDSYIQKLSELQQKQRSAFGTNVYRKAADEFTKAAREIASSSASTAEKLEQLKNKFTQVRGAASIRLEGTFFEKFARLAGLATTRLASFLIVSRGLFAIQNAFIQAFRAATELDTQFVKLEQVFAKSSTTTSTLADRTERLKDNVFELGTTYGVATEQITTASRVLAQAGIVGNNLEAALTAITKAQLGPTFNDINQTAEASVAILNQFDLEAKSLENTLGGINRVSALYAVEAEGISKAVRKAGGAFKGAGGEIDEFVSLFTILKSETREADEALATGLRNIAIRIQRSSLQEKISDSLFGTGRNEFLNADGLFIGINNALDKIVKRFEELNIGADSGDPLFANVLETLAGARQFSRLQPIIKNFREADQIRREFQDGAGSLDEDAGRAIETVGNKVEKLKNSFAELANVLVESKFVKSLLDLANIVVQGFTAAAKAVDNLSLALGVLTSVGISGLVRSRFADFFLLGARGSGFRAQNIVGNNSGGLIGRNSGGFISRQTGGGIGISTGLANKLRLSGGLIPGGGINKDTIATGLTRGEFVINRNSSDTLGLPLLNALNRSPEQFVNSGGMIGRNSGGSVGILSRVVGGPALPLDPFDRIKLAFDAGGGRFVGGLNSVGGSAAASGFLAPPKKALDIFGKDISTVSKVTQKAATNGAKLSTSLKGILPKLLKFGSVIGVAVTGISLLAANSKEGGGAVSSLAKAAIAATSSVLTFSFLFKTLTPLLRAFRIGLLRPGLAGQVAKGANAGIISTGAIRAGSALSRSGLGKTAVSLVTKFGRLVPVIGTAILAFVGIKSAIQSFVGDTLKNAKERLSNAETQEEVTAASEDVRSAQALSNRFNIIGKIGNVFGKLGGVLDVVIDRLSTFGKFLLDSIGGIKQRIRNSSGFGKTLVDSIGAMDSFIDYLTTDAETSARLNNQLRSDTGRRSVEVGVNDLGTNLESNDIKGFGKNLRTSFDSLFSALQAESELTGKSFSDVLRNNSELKEGAKGFADRITEAVRAGGDFDLDSIKKAANLTNDEFNKLEKILKNAGIDFDPKIIQNAATAFDKISLLFLRIETIVNRANNNLLQSESRLDAFRQRANAVSGRSADFSLNDRVFESLGAGFGTSRGNRQRINNLIGGDQALREAFNLEVGIKEASRKVNELIAAQGDSIKLPNKSADAIAAVLSDQFAKVNATPAVQDLFEDFVQKNLSDISGNIRPDGAGFDLSAGEISNFVKKFADQNSGAIDVIRKRAELEKKFNSQFQVLLTDRIAAENKLTQRVTGLIDSQVARTEFRNRVGRADGSGDLTIAQARAFDVRNQANQLRGTGLGGRASIRDIGRAFVQSQQRQRQAIGRRDNLAITREEQIQSQLSSTLETLAKGGREAAAAANDFNKAVEESKKTSEFFRSTLLGSDQQLINTAKGFDLLNKVRNAGSREGAFNAIFAASESARSGFQNILSGSPSDQRAVDRILGVGSPLGRTPEAQAQDAQLAKQEAANKELVALGQRQIVSQDNLANELRNIQQKEIAALQGGIAQFNNLIQGLNNAVANVPNQINHQFNIPPIQVNFNNAAGLERLQEGFKNVIASTIQAEINKNNAGLRRLNGNQLQVPNP